MPDEDFRMPELTSAVITLPKLEGRKYQPVEEGIATLRQTALVSPSIISVESFDQQSNHSIQRIVVNKRKKDSDTKVTINRRNMDHRNHDYQTAD